MKKEMTKENIVSALNSVGAKTLTDIYRGMGGEGKLSGSTANKMRSLVPDIETLLASNREASKPSETVSKKVAVVESVASPESVVEPAKPVVAKKKKMSVESAKVTVKVSKKSDSPNPFRPGSGYALAFDVLAAHPEGLSIVAWREAYAKASNKDQKLARYDTQVLLTAKESIDGHRHKSCRNGFYIERTGDIAKLVMA